MTKVRILPPSLNFKIMTKKDLTQKVAAKLNVSNEEAALMVESVIDSISGIIYSGNTLYLRGFGTLGPKRMAAKMARNIKANTSLQLEERYKIAFKASKEKLIELNTSLK